MRKILYFLSLLIFFVACKKNVENTDFKVSGIVKNAKQNSLVYLYYRGGDYTEKQDSCFIEDSTFTLSGKSKQDIDIFFLEFPGKPYYIYLLADSGDNVKLRIDLDTMQMYKVETNGQSKLIQQLENHLFVTNEKLAYALRNGGDTTSIKQEQREFSLNFVSKYDTSLAVIIAFSEKFVDGQPVLPISQYFDLYKKTARILGKRYAGTEYYSKFIEFIKNYEINLARNQTPQTEKRPGELVDFQSVSIQGQKFNLSDFRNKRIVLNFTASWCNDCNNLYKIFVKASSEKRNIQIVQIFLDTDQSKVESVVKKYNINYPVVVDKDLWNSEIVEKYKIEQLPTTIFISPDNKIEKYIEGADIEKVKKFLDR